MRGREPAVPVRLVRHRRQLGHGVRGAVGIGGAGRAAARHDLDVVGALLEQLADLGAHGRLAVGLGAEVAHVSARHRDGPPADDHARPRGEPAADALAQREGHPALGAVLAERGDAGVQQGARVLRGLEQQDVVVFLRDVVAEGAVAWRDEVRVGVDEPGQDRGARRSPSGPRRRRPAHGPRAARPMAAMRSPSMSSAACSTGAPAAPSSRRAAVISVKRAGAAPIEASSRALEGRHDLCREALELLEDHRLRRADGLPDVDDLEPGYLCWTSISCSAISSGGPMSHVPALIALRRVGRLACAHASGRRPPRSAPASGPARSPAARTSSRAPRRTAWSR